MTEHIEELAELYVLGSLDDLERVRVERHVASCSPCATRLHDAEETVASVAEAQPQHQAPARLQARLRTSIGTARARSSWSMLTAAIAAILIVAIVPTWMVLNRNRASVVAMRQDEQALAKIASGPFHRAQFMSPENRPMNAKVLYGPQGDWYYVVVMHPRPNMQVAYVHEGKMQMLGRVAMHGESGTLFLPVNHKMDELALLEGDKVVAAARLAY